MDIEICLHIRGNLINVFIYKHYHMSSTVQSSETWQKGSESLTFYVTHILAETKEWITSGAIKFYEGK